MRIEFVEGKVPKLLSKIVVVVVIDQRVFP